MESLEQYIIRSIVDSIDPTIQAELEPDNTFIPELLEISGIEYRLENRKGGE